MLQDFSDSFKAYLYDRTTSPLFGAFTFSWAVWNYEVILTILSGWSVDKKIYFMETTLFPYDPCESWLFNNFIHSLDLFFLPLISAVIILLVYPFPSQWIYVQWKSHQVKMHDAKLKLEKVQLVSNDVHEKLREEYFNLKTKLQNEIRTKDEEIEFLQKSLNDKGISSDVVEKDNADIESQNDYEQENLIGKYEFKDEKAKYVLKAIANLDGEAINTLISNNAFLKDLGKTKINYYIDQFKRDNLVKQTTKYVYLTERGRIVAVEQKLV